MPLRDGLSTDVPVGGPAPDVEETLEEILELVGHGSVDAFTRLYERTAGRLFALAASVVWDVGQSQEVTQEVYLQIWQRAARFDPAKGSALTWLMTITRRRAVDRVRHSQANKIRDSSYAVRSWQPDFDAVADQVVRTDQARRLRAALSDLTSIQQEAIILTYFHGHTHLEASKILGVPLGTLKGRVREALSTMKGRAQPLA